MSAGGGGEGGGGAKKNQKKNPEIGWHDTYMDGPYVIGDVYVRLGI